MFHKDLHSTVLNIYLSKFTFIKLLGSKKDNIEEIINIFSLKRVCKEWKNIIEKYFIKEWSIMSFKKDYATFKLALDIIINQKISLVYHDPYWNCYRVFILKKSKEKVVLRYLNFQNLKINILHEIPINFSEIICTENICNNSFRSIILKIIKYQSIGPSIILNKCKCSEDKKITNKIYDYDVFYHSFYPNLVFEESSIEEDFKLFIKYIKKGCE